MRCLYLHSLGIFELLVDLSTTLGVNETVRAGDSRPDQGNQQWSFVPVFIRLRHSFCLDTPKDSKV